jgi:hypothetical protein
MDEEEMRGHVSSEIRQTCVVSANVTAGRKDNKSHKIRKVEPKKAANKESSEPLLSRALVT